MIFRIYMCFILCVSNRITFGKRNNISFKLSKKGIHTMYAFLAYSMNIKQTPVG